jgi:hypothetical protein
MKRRTKMQKRLILLVTGLLALGAAGIANAAVLNWEGTSTTYLADYPDAPLAGGGVATVNGSSGGVPAHLGTLRLAASRGNIGGTFTQFVTDPESAGDGVAALIFTMMQARTGSIAPISGGVASTAFPAGGAMAVGGLVKVCILSTTCTQFVPLVLTGPTTVNGVTGSGIQGAGVGGLVTAGGYGGIRISMQGAPWTIKTGTVIDQITTTGGARIYTKLAYKGWAHAPVSTTSSTAQPGGVLQLVMPNQVTTNLALGSSAKMASAMVMVLRFVPEPGLLLLLGSGVAGLAMLGRGRIERRPRSPDS